MKDKVSLVFAFKNHIETLYFLSLLYEEVIGRARYAISFSDGRSACGRFFA